MREAELKILGVLAALVLAAFVVTTPVGHAELSGSGSDLGQEAEEAHVSRVLITEILANPIGSDDQEWIELGNKGSGAVELGGLSLMVGTKKYVIPVSSGSVLEPGQYRLFPKPITALTLTNTGGEAKLMSGAQVLDALNYPETGEEVSYGRNLLDPFLLQPFCVPTPALQNEEAALNPQIVIQSGELIKKESTALNLAVEVQGGGSLAQAACHFDYSDGFASDSCNPPSHTFKKIGPFSVTLTVQTMCGFIERSLSGEVLPEEVAAHSQSSVQWSTSSASSISSCTPTVFSGISVSEFLPSPAGEDSEGEWIELQNENDSAVELCGWSLDDEEGGSAPYTLDGYTIPARGFLDIWRGHSGIALNNDRDSVRLFGPDVLAGSGLPTDQISYQRASEDESYAKIEAGVFDWTPYPTPALPNRFEQIIRDASNGAIIVSAALPNPKEDDRYHEWIEVTNIGEASFSLDGWMIDNHDGSSPPYVMSGITLAPAASKRFFITETQIVLANAADSVRLMDPSGTVVSAFDWKDAVENKIYRLPFLSGVRVPIKIVRVIDGDTIEVAFTDMDSLRELPDSVQRRWLAAGLNANPRLVVRLIGVNAKETVHPLLSASEQGSEASSFLKSIAEGKTGVIEFDAEIWDTYDRMLGYVYLDSGESLQRLLIQNGLANVFTKFPFARQTEYELLAEQLGNWEIGDLENEDSFSVAEEEDESVLAEELNSLVSYQTGVIISEVFASPDTSAVDHLLKTEWIELFNESDVPVSLSGWKLDDILVGGSRAWEIPTGTQIQPGEFLIFTKEMTKLSLNNDADEVHLLLPNGTVASVLLYGKHAKGSAIALSDGFYCETTQATPSALNVCVEKQVKVSTTQKTVKTTVTRAKSFTIPVKYTNTSVDEPKVMAAEFVGTSGMYTDLQILSQKPVSIADSGSSGFVLSVVIGAALGAFLSVTFLPFGTIILKRTGNFMNLTN